TGWRRRRDATRGRSPCPSTGWRWTATRWRVSRAPASIASSSRCRRRTRTPSSACSTAGRPSPALPPEMDLGLAGKRALVTGSSAGIGRAIAAALAAEGARVTLCARRPEPLETAAAELRAQGAEVIAVAADLATDEGVERVWEAHVAAFGGADVLVNNVTGGA